jgi:hypothetical protein
MKSRRILRNGTGSVIATVALGVGVVVGCGQVPDQVRPAPVESDIARRTPASATASAEAIEQHRAAADAAAARRREEASRDRLNEMRVRIAELKDADGTR